jgi:uncharacterized circularly permuted ATP-grasp superfamily protein
MGEPYEIEAKDSFAEFLEKTAFINEMVHKTTMTHFQVVMCQRAFRRHMEGMEARVLHLHQEVWDRECANLIVYFKQLKKPTKEEKKLPKKLLAIPDEARMRVIQLYVVRQHLLHNVKFI